MDRPHVFFSYHYEVDADRALAVRALDVVDAPDPEPDEVWAHIRTDHARVRSWVDESLRGKDALVVLVGARTWARPLVRLEVERAVAFDMPILGIRIHNVLERSPTRSGRGLNPFKRIALIDAWGMPAPRKLFDPDPYEPLAGIRDNMIDWVRLAWQARRRRERERATSVAFV